MRRSPPTFQPGPLTRTQAEALNQLARDLYGSLLDRFSAAPPLQVRQGLDGVAYSLGPIATAGGIVTRTTVGSIHSADYGPRPRLNFTEGTNITISMADDPTDNEIDITISAALGAGADPNCWLSYSAALDTDQNDYNPSALLWWRLSRGSSPANVNITGIVAGDDGCPILITHAGRTASTGAFGETITLKNQSASSAAANRIIVSDYEGFGDRVLHSGESVLLRYDLSRNRWRVIELPAASATQPGTVSLVKQTMGAGEKDFSDKVGIGTTSALANSALDVRGYTYAYFSGALSFGGGSLPASEAAGCVFQYSSPDVVLTMPSAAYTAGRVGGWRLEAANSRFVIRHKTAAARKISWYNDDTAAYDDGVTGTYESVTTIGGVVVGGSTTSTITVGSTAVSGGTTGSMLSTDGSGNLAQTSFADSNNVIGSQVFGA